MMRKQEKILKCHEINTNDLDPEFKNHFKSVSAKSLSKEQIAKRLKNCIAANMEIQMNMLKLLNVAKKIQRKMKNLFAVCI